MVAAALQLGKFGHYAFDAGENSGEPPTFLSKSELSRTLNVENRGDGIETRFGSTVFNTSGGYPSPIASNPVINSIMGISYGSGAVTYDSLFTGGTSIYRNLLVPVAIKTGLSGSGLQFQMVRSADFFYMSNGTDPVYYYDPARSTAAVYTAGYDTPAAFTATANGAGGSMAAGTYEYYATLWDSTTFTESNFQAAAVSVTTVGATSRVDLSLLPLDSESRSTHWKIYRKDPTGVYHYYLATVTYNAGVRTYSDTAALTGSSEIAQLDNDKPDPSTVMCLHGKKMIYASGNTFSWSKDYRHQNVPTYNRENLYDHSQKIEAAVSFNDEILVIFKTESIYVILGNLSQGYKVQKIAGKVGTKSPMSCKSFTGGVFFLDQNKRARLLNPTDFSLEDLRDNTDISHDYRKKFDLISTAALNQCHAVIWETSSVTQYRLFVPADTDSIYPNHCYVFDYGLAARNQGQSAWFDFSLNFSPVCSTSTVSDGGERQLQCGDDYGLLWRTDVPDIFYDGDDYVRAEAEGTIAFGANTVTITTPTMTVNQFKGLQLIIYESYTYREIFRSRITSNTTTVFTVEDAIPTLVSADPFITVGGYPTYFLTGQYSNDRAGRCRPFKLHPEFSTKYDNSDIQMCVMYDSNEAFNYTYDYINNIANASLTPLADNYTLSIGATSAVYDASTSLYDAARYGITLYGNDEFKLNSKYLFLNVMWGVVTREPNKAFGYIGATMSYQYKRYVPRSS